MGDTFTMRPAVRHATTADAEQVAELIANAFAGLRAVTYLVPERRERHKVLTANFLIFIEHALEHGEIHLIDDGPAVAVWLPRPCPPPRDYDRRLAEATGEWADRFRTVNDLMHAHLPTEPHHHLAFLAVHPTCQNQGLGTTLLRHHHAHLKGLPAYLEASDPRNRDLYERHGYQQRSSYSLPDGAQYWPMLKPGTL